MEKLVSMEFDNYRNKKVFLTGHTGFKGSWMLTWLHSLGAVVKGYGLQPKSQSDLYNLINGDNLCQSVFADIKDKTQLEKEILTFEPDFIFHLAAQPLVRLSYDIPSETFEVNAIGTAHVLDAVRKLKNQCAVVLITTDKVYENLEWHYPYREVDRLGGYDPYSASKACAEIIISSYRNSFFNVKDIQNHKKYIASARAGNVIGGGDWAKDRIIPDIIKALQNEEPIEVRNPNAIRPWQHVLEPLAGYLQLGKKLVEDPAKYADAWNFGPFNEDNLTVSELTKIAIEIWGSGSTKNIVLKNQPHEAALLKLDINKVINELGWKPRMNARQAIDKTISWYKNLSTTAALDLVINDIDYYYQKNTVAL
jgi:CDP-glucose 4,6-dehydratase